MRFMSWKAGILLDSLWYHVQKTEENGEKQEHIRQIVVQREAWTSRI